MKVFFRGTPVLVLSSLCLLTTGCLTTRAQLREHNEESSNKPAAASTPQPAQVQEVQPQGSYAIDEIKGELTRVNGRLEDLERSRREASADPSTAQTRDDVKKLEARITELEKAQAQMLDAIKKIQENQTAAAQAQADPDEALNRGKEAFSSGNYDSAIESLTGALRSAKGRSAEDATFLRAESFYALKQYKKAIVDFSRFPEKYSRSKYMPSALYKIGLSFDALGMRDDAKGFYQELEDKFPKSAEAKKVKKKLRG